MEVTRYIFQSPYSNQVQIGKPDAVSSQEAKSEDLQLKQTKIAPIGDSSVKTQDSTDAKATPKVEANLDTYV